MGDDCAPRVDDHGVAPGLAAILVAAALGRGEHPRACLDGTRAQQHLPMSLPGGTGEGAGHRQHTRPRLGEQAVEIGEAQVVADREPDDSRCGGGDHGTVAGFVVRRLLPALSAADLDIEHVDLVVARLQLTLRTEEAGAVDRAAVRSEQGERAAQQIDAVGCSQIGEPNHCRVLVLRTQDREERLPVFLNQVRRFRRSHELRAVRGRFADQRLGIVEIALRVGAGPHLDESDLHRGHYWAAD